LLASGAVTTGVRVLLLIGGFAAFSTLVANAGALNSSGDGTVAVTVLLVGAAAAVIGILLFITALVRRQRA